MTANPTVTERCVGSLSQVPPGEGRQFVIDGRLVAVFHLRGGGVHATQAACPHRGGPVADGIVGGTTVICPLHARKFDLTTRQALNSDCAALATYPARVTDDGKIVVILGT